MTKTTILEKFKIIFEVSKQSKLFIAVIAFILLLAIIALTTNKNNAKKSKSLYAIIYSAGIITLLITYHESLGKMFDYMMNNLFIVVYFPNIAVYMAAILITNIIFLVSIFNFKTSKTIKIINTTVYGIIHYLLALVLNIISKNNLDIFSQTSLYGNERLQAIVEFTSGIFMIWLVFLGLYKLIRKYQVREEKVEVPVAQKVIVKKVRRLPAGIKEVEVPLYVKALPRKDLTNINVEEPVLIGKFVSHTANVSEEITQELLETKSKLEEANLKLEVQEEQLKATTDKQSKFYQEKIKFEESYTKLYELQQNQIKVREAELAEKTKKLEEERRVLKEAKAAFEETKAKPPVLDATAQIMQNLDGMLTLEDYKILATMLKQKQKKNNEVKNAKIERENEQLKFAQLREAYRNAS